MREQASVILQNGTVIPAMPLVLNAQRQLDEARQRRLLRYYLCAGVGGIAVAVHTTQFEIRAPHVDLFAHVLALAAEEITAYERKTGKTIVKIAGVCGEGTQAVQEATLAKAYGYDAVLLSPGGLAHCSEAQLLQRTQSVAQVMPVVGFYLQVSVGGRRFSYEYWQQLCEIEGVVAIKTAPFDRYMTLDAARAVACSSRAAQIALYTGNDDNLLCDLLTSFAFEKDGETRKVAFVGGLLGHWAVWTHTAVAYFNAVQQAKQSGNISPQLLTLAAQITDANAAFFDVQHDFEGCIVGLHEVLRRQGLLEGIWTLSPSETLCDQQRAEIDRVYAQYPHLNDDAFVAAFLQEDAKA